MINLSESRNVYIEQDNQGHATLTLRRVNRSDAGLYYCVAQSRSGRAKCSARLNIRGQCFSNLYVLLILYSLLFFDSFINSVISHLFYFG